MPRSRSIAAAGALIGRSASHTARLTTASGLAVDRRSSPSRSRRVKVADSSMATIAEGSRSAAGRARSSSERRASAGNGCSAATAGGSATLSGSSTAPAAATMASRVATSSARATTAIDSGASGAAGSRTSKNVELETADPTPVSSIVTGWIPAATTSSDAAASPPISTGTERSPRATPSATVNTPAAASVTESTTGESVRSRSAASVTAWWTLTTSSARSSGVDRRLPRPSPRR